MAEDYHISEVISIYPNQLLILSRRATSNNVTKSCYA